MPLKIRFCLIIHKESVSFFLFPIQFHPLAANNLLYTYEKPVRCSRDNGMYRTNIEKYGNPSICEIRPRQECSRCDGDRIWA